MHASNNKSYVKGGKPHGSSKSMGYSDDYESGYVDSYSPVEDDENGEVVIVISAKNKKSRKKKIAKPKTKKSK